MATYDLYGVKADSLLEVKNLIESLLSIKFEEHSSSFYRGEIYFYHMGIDKESLKIVINLDPYEDEPLEDEHSDVNIILYVDNTNRSQELTRILTSASSGVITLLRHEILGK